MKLVNAALEADQSIVRIQWSTTANCGHLYWAFTEGLSDWLGAPSSMSTPLEPGAAFCIDAGQEWGGRSHYGRFVQLHQDRRIAMTWISESLGGVESDVVIDLVRADGGTAVCIDHAGVTDPEARASVGSFWLGARHAIDTIIVSAQPNG
jgi:uncharacterized protein YndB with AHSA1/START domain